MEEKPAYVNARITMKTLSKSPSARLEAGKLLVSTINKLKQTAQTAYNGDVLFTVVTVDAHHLRRAKREDAGDNPHNLAKLTSADYPVIFNIIFWFSIVFIFSLLAISLALSNVEDKDSIIYRMTGARGKKEN